MKFFKHAFLASLFLSTSLFASQAPLNLRHSISLDNYKGQTYLEMMMARDGVKAHFDEDYIDTYEFASWEQVKFALGHLDTKIVRNVMSAFEGSEAKLKEFTQKLTHTKVRPESMVGVIQKNYKGSGNIFVLAHFFGLASEAGTLVKINKENYFYNFGYKKGDEADDVKSGRSYGASPLHAANDASDVMYLNELDKYFSEENDEEDFYRSILEVLTQVNTAGFSKNVLTSLGQGVATDFITIYTAELNRHIMVDLHPSVHPWENDLAEATFVSIFSAKTGKLMNEGKLVDSPLKGFWALSSSGSGRSGIGINRRDRRKLQVLISAFERQEHPALVSAVEKVTGKRADGDIFRGLMEYLNNARTQSSVHNNAQAVTRAFVQFLMQVQSDSSKIVSYIAKVK